MEIRRSSRVRVNPLLVCIIRLRIRGCRVGLSAGERDPASLIPASLAFGAEVSTPNCSISLQPWLRASSKKKLIFVSLALALALVLAFAKASAQEKPDQKPKATSHTKTITGCVHKGDEPEQFSITGEDGETWGLRSSTVKLDKHLGHKVTVAGPVTHESRPEELTKEEKMEKREYGELRVTSLKMVSETCSK